MNVAVLCCQCRIERSFREALPIPVGNRPHPSAARNNAWAYQQYEKFGIKYMASQRPSDQLAV
jgi:hypothetical protein